MKKMTVLTALIACAAVCGGRARAETGSALGCLQASAQNGGLAACLHEPGKGASEAVVAGATASRPAASSPLSVADLEAGEKKRTTTVPTPTGYASAEEGTLKAGFYNGLDSGFKTVFMGIVYPAVAGIEAFGAPQETNAGTVAFTALGVLLAIPAAIIAGVLGAPIGAAAGMIAEKAAPGSTKDWFTF